MSFILADPALQASLRDEAIPVLYSCTSATDFLNKLSLLPKLESTAFEALRISSTAQSSRQVLSDTKLPSGNTLAAHSDLIIVNRTGLHDASIFGEDINTFHWDRFLGKEDLAKADAYRPFGGGIGLCPGRFLAKATIMMVAALMLTRYEIDASPSGYKVPRMDTKTPPAGILDPAAGEDMVVRVKPRKQ